MPAAVVALVPAEFVGVVRECEGMRRLKGDARATRDFELECFQTVIVDGVLQPCALAHRAVAPVALGGDHGFGDRDHLVRRDEADHVGDARIGFGIAVGRAHAAADADVVAEQGAVVAAAVVTYDRDEAQILREDIDIVTRRHRERDLELARQVGRTVDRLFFFAAAGDFFLVQPDFVVGAAVGKQMLRQRFGLRLHRGMHLREIRIGGHRDIAVDVAAGGEGVDQRGVDRLHRRLQFALDDAVELESLAGGDAQAALGVGGRDGVEFQPLRRRDHAARGAGADHEREVGFELLAAAHVAHVAVVLLVAAVILDEGLIVVGQRAGDLVRQRFDQRAAQTAALLFDVFDRVSAHLSTRPANNAPAPAGC